MYVKAYQDLSVTSLVCVGYFFFVRAPGSLAGGFLVAVADCAPLLCCCSCSVHNYKRLPLDFFCCERLSASMARSLRLELYLYTAVDSRPGPGGSRTTASCQP